MRWFCILSLIAVALVACDRRQQEAAPETTMPPPTAAATENTAARIAAPSSDGNGVVELNLLPPKPRITDSVQVSVGGCTQNLGVNWLVNGKPLASGSASIAPGNFRRGDLLRVEVRCGEKHYSREVEITNTPPQIERLGFAGGSITSGQPITLVAQTADIDGDEVKVGYRWFVDGEELLDVIGDTLPAEYVKADHMLMVIAVPNDGTDDGPEYTPDLLLLPNGSPRIVSNPPSSFSSDGYRYAVVAIDPDQDPLTFRLEEAPEGMSIDSQTGEIFWPQAPELTGEFRVRIIVEDAAGNLAKQEYPLTLSYKEPE